MGSRNAAWVRMMAEAPPINQKMAGEAGLECRPKTVSVSNSPDPADEIQSNGSVAMVKNTYACCCVNMSLVPKIGVGVFGVMREMLNTATRTIISVAVRKRFVMRV